MNDYGTPEERDAVKAACEAIRVLNRRLDVCADLGIKCRLEASGRSGYIAEFTKTTSILPSP